MAFEDIVLSNAANYGSSRISRQLISSEISRCSGRLLYPQCTQLEPPFVSFCNLQNIRSIFDKRIDIIYEPRDESQALCRCDILPSFEYEHRWDKADIFLRHLPALYNRCGFEIIGNCRKIKFKLLCNKQDTAVLSSTFCSKFTDCAIRPGTEQFFPYAPSCLKFRDYYTPGLYSHLLTQPPAFKTSAYDTFLYVLAGLPEDTLGFCQVLFEATKPENDWHRNIEILTVYEYMNGLAPGLAGRNPQQVPDNALVRASEDVNTKSHPDKPFFAVALRVGICGADNSNREDLLHCLSSFTHLFQHGSRPLEYISSNEYGDINTQEMLEHGLVYHPGMLFNSSELSGLVHIPPIELFKIFSGKLKLLSPLFRNSMGVVTMDTSIGTLIGYRQADYGREAFVIPDKLRKKHCHVIGKPGGGKSVLLENEILNDISHRHGLVVIDPHGDLINRLLDLIPEEAVERTVLFDPGDDEWVPLYNPLRVLHGTDLSVASDNIISVLKSVFGEGWGLRMEHILRNLILALMHIKGMSFLDLTEILRRDTEKSKKIINRLEEAVTNNEVLNFLKYDFKKYRPEELTPALHRLSPLIYSETKSLSLLQPENRFDFQDFMDNGMILLVNLASLGREHIKGMGGFILTSLHCAVMERLKIPPNQRKLFNIYVDEAHLFDTDATEKMMAEARKCNVSFNLAHQYLTQFKRERVDSLMTAGTTITFCVGAGDAGVMTKNYQNKTKSEEFMELGVGEAIVRVDSDIAKIKTLGPRKITKNYRHQIIRNSHMRYCKPVQEVRRKNKLRFRSHHNPFGNIIPEDLVRSVDSGRIGVYERYD